MALQLIPKVLGSVQLGSMQTKSELHASGEQQARERVQSAPTVFGSLQVVGEGLEELVPIEGRGAIGGNFIEELETVGAVGGVIGVATGGKLKEGLETGDAIGEGTQIFVVKSHSKGLQHARVPLQSAPTVFGKPQSLLRAARAVENVAMLEPPRGEREPLPPPGKAQRYVDLSHHKGLQHWPVSRQSAPTLLGRVHSPGGDGVALEDIEVVDVIG